jgi:DNA-binding NarL/FixJ family response regulator
MKKRVVIVDDHPIVRQGFKQLIDAVPDLEVVGEADDAATALSLIASELPDLALVDLSLKDRSGLELIKICESPIHLFSFSLYLCTTRMCMQSGLFGPVPGVLS